MYILFIFGIGTYSYVYVKTTGTITPEQPPLSYYHPLISVPSPSHPPNNVIFFNSFIPSNHYKSISCLSVWYEWTNRCSLMGTLRWSYIALKYCIFGILPLSLTQDIVFLPPLGLWLRALVLRSSPVEATAETRGSGVSHWPTSGQCELLRQGKQFKIIINHQ